jgi:hypothetical protein
MTIERGKTFNVAEKSLEPSRRVAPANIAIPT